MESWARPPTWRRALLFVVVAAALYELLSPLMFKAGVYSGAWLEHRYFLPDVAWKDLVYIHASGQGQLPGPAGLFAAQLVNFIAVGGLLAGFLILLALVYRLPLSGWITSARRFRWRLLIAGFVGPAALSSASSAVFWAISPKPFQFASAFQGTSLPIAIATVIGLTAMLGITLLFEELVFRGWVLQQGTALLHRRRMVLLLSALLFVIAHGRWSFLESINVFAGGIGFGVAALRLRGLEFSWGAHLAGDLIILVSSPRAAIPDGHYSGGKAVIAWTAVLMATASIGLWPILVAEVAGRSRWLGAQQ